MSKANFVPMDQFNTAFEAWMREQLLQRKQQILQQQQSQQQGSLQK